MADAQATNVHLSSFWSATQGRPLEPQEMISQNMTAETPFLLTLDKIEEGKVERELLAHEGQNKDPAFARKGAGGKTLFLLYI